MNSPNSNDPTINQQREPLPPQSDSVPQHPEQIGRYKIERVLGEGGFGLVYLARDEELDRPVALKVPRANRTTCADAYFAEARMVANLDFPGIVPVYDVGRTETCPCYIVSKYVEGMDLSKRLKQSRMTYRESAELIAAVAESLHYAHTKDLVHRDIKPGNILVSSDGKPHVVDFGLALREENVGKGPRSAGTLAYMSPEQARGEGHRVNGCSDIFALGVVFYELLAGRRPFRGDTQQELLDQIISHEPKPLRQYDETIPKELQRICFKAMSKRAADRYSSAYDMAEDLRLFLSELSTKPGAIRSTENFSPRETFQTDPSPTKAVPPVTATPNKGSSDSAPIRIIPKGLRSFDAHDADFFLELLPGPRDRDGLPDNLRFWKLRIEETDPDETFAVGLIYGPSGCGKSSLVKAGLLPRLSKDVITVYIEATPEETETRLLNNIRKRCPGHEEKQNLKDTMADLRKGQGIPAGKKVLIVLDQFEQWLHATKDQKETELVQALRQCDGAKTQCLVLVRDDFWLASSRLGSELEVDFVLGKNMSLIDLFDLEHAHKVLAAFGRAFGKLPNSGIGLNKDQNTFLRDSVEGLAQDKKVNCVRIALFAEMMKGKEWTSAVLKEVGGTRGIGQPVFRKESPPTDKCRYMGQSLPAVLPTTREPCMQGFQRL